MHKKLLVSLFAVSLLLSTPSLLRIPLVLPFLDADVRRTAPQAVDKIREQGLWAINAELHSVEKNSEEICFTWDHQYRKRDGFLKPSIITTCVP
jgi:hypothetical protein